MKICYRQTVFNHAELIEHSEIASNLDEIFTGDEHACKQAFILTWLAFCGDKPKRMAMFNDEFKATLKFLIKISAGKKIKLRVAAAYLQDFKSLCIIEAIKTSVHGDVVFMFNKEKFIDYCNSKRNVH